MRQVSSTRLRGATAGFHGRGALLAAALFLTGCGGGGGAPAGSPGTGLSPTAEPPAATRGVLVQLAPGQDPAALAREYGVVLEASDAGSNLYLLRTEAAGEGQDGALAQRLQQDGRFLAAEADGGVKSPESRRSIDGFPIHVAFDFVGVADAQFSALTGPYSFSFRAVATDFTTNTGVDAAVNLADSQTVATGAGVTVAVLDTGVMADHPLLQGRLVQGYNAISPDAAPSDLPDGTANEVVGHGTMVAGVIARVAPGARIMPVRVLDGDGNGSLYNVARGIRWAVARGARVLNLSFGTRDAGGILRGALADARRAGVVIVASAGNDGAETPEYPAAYEGVLAVASVENDGRRSDFSNYGGFVSLAAPGSGIRSTYTNGGFASWSGTSFAAPFASAAAALVLSAGPGMDANAAARRLLGSARPVDAVNPGFAGKLGAGMIDIRAALSAGTPVSVPSPSPKGGNPGNGGGSGGGGGGRPG